MGQFDTKIKKTLSRPMYVDYNSKKKIEKSLEVSEKNCKRIGQNKHFLGIWTHAPHPQRGPQFLFLQFRGHKHKPKTE